MIAPVQSNQIAATDAPKRKGGGDVAPAARIQDSTMLNVDEAALAGKESSHRRNSTDRNASLWLSSEIEKAQAGVTTQIVALTPALARVLLSRNPGNRKLSLASVDKYARDISNGSWSFNGEPVIVSRDGQLNDGQHRCEAVIAADMAIDVVLVIGTERQTRFTIDQGKTRSAGDYLGMNGKHDGLALAAAAGFVWQHREHGRLSQQTAHKATKGEVMAVVDAHPDLEESLAAIPSKGSDLAGGRSVLAFCHWTFSRRTPRAEVDRFFAMLVTGENLLASDPVLYARNRMITMRGKLNPNEKAELIFRAWGAHRRREKPKTLPILNGALPIVER